MSKNDLHQQEELIRQLVSKIEALGQDCRDQAARLDMAHAEIDALKQVIDGMVAAQQASTKEASDAVSVTVHRDRRHSDRRSNGAPRRSGARESLCWDRRLGDRRSNGQDVTDGIIFI